MGIPTAPIPNSTISVASLLLEAASFPSELEMGTIGVLAGSFASFSTSRANCHSATAVAAKAKALIGADSLDTSSRFPPFDM
jgi:hypothetical protein